MRHRLSDLESRVEKLVEGSFARLLGGRLEAEDVALALRRALEDAAAAGLAPVSFQVRLCPADAQRLLGEAPRLPERLADELVSLARELHLTLPQRPEVLLLPEPALKLRALRITPVGADPGITGRTQTGAAAGAADAPAPAAPAFLIVDGRQTFLLEGPSISLGRRLDNHIILDDARVSRAHAQIRLRFGRRVLYDLGSSGGTFVNGRRIQECVLRPGDVISLSGLALIYGEEEPAPGR